MDKNQNLFLPDLFFLSHSIFRRILMSFVVSSSVENSNESNYDYDEGEEESPLQMWLEGDSLAPPCQADLDVVRAILQLAAPLSTSVLYDLGCGDGRICIEATKRFGCRSIGCEIEPSLIARFQHHLTNINNPELTNKISVVHDDLRSLSLEDATIIILYLLPESVEEIKPKLIAALRRGAVLICNTWGPKGLTPVDTLVVGFSNNVPLLRYDATSLPT